MPLYSNKEATQQSSGLGTPKSIMHSQSKEDLCKLSRIANQPHIQALSPSTKDKENHNHQERTASIPIKKNNNRALHSPIPSPNDYNYGSSIPKSLERPKSKSLLAKYRGNAAY
jgi:phosphoinositide-3-kinase regulatory subunit 4